MSLRVISSATRAASRRALAPTGIRDIAVTRPSNFHRLLFPCVRAPVQYRSVSTEAALDDRKCSTELRQSGLPTPTAMPMRITAAELRALMDDPALDAGKDYLVVDVRRTDMDEAPSNIVHPSAVNLPAQTFHQTLPVIYALLHRIPRVIFHCGSSKERGPKCAGWYQGFLDLKGCETSKAYVLVGGIKAWREGGYSSITIH
ncbi:hypothetical protein EHS25_010184 [Saitozyma podzolica]|uniref:Rhodanese domain-containing protein n=1 Tax=Saitozyma podzolica TaxID=1890683 RepID=A0A427YIU6_9TREE|nr:hypothetical protein EHS25_010184 [Saitozyma podzolica]